MLNILHFKQSVTFISNKHTANHKFADTNKFALTLMKKSSKIKVVLSVDWVMLNAD